MWTVAIRLICYDLIVFGRSLIFVARAALLILLVLLLRRLILSVRVTTLLWGAMICKIDKIKVILKALNRAF